MERDNLYGDARRQVSYDFCRRVALRRRRRPLGGSLLPCHCIAPYSRGVGLTHIARQGLNLGKSGLFPQRYATHGPSGDLSAPTLNGGHLHAIPEESGSKAPVVPNITSPVPKQPPATFSNGHATEIESPTPGMLLREPSNGEWVNTTLPTLESQQLWQYRI